MTIHALAAYLLAAMVAWVPMKNHAYYEREEVTSARYTAISQDIATVSLLEKEEPLYVGVDDSGRVKTALLVASTASFESAFEARVDDGRKLGDHGTAYCIMQIHPESGVYLDGGTYGYASRQSRAWIDANRDKLIFGKDLIENRQTCIRVGLHMMRDTFTRVHHLGIYTGEGSKEGPNAKHRLERAKTWMKDHPFVPTEI